MPNHTANRLTVTGPDADVRRFIENARGELQPISFNRLYPIPDDIKNVHAPTQIMTQEQIDEQWAEWNQLKLENKLTDHNRERPLGLGITQEKSQEFHRKYGSNNWYDWCIENWSTKWDCYEVNDDWEIVEIRGGGASANIYYETAWSPATNLLEKVSKEYPTLEFTHEYADEGLDFLGLQTIKNGEITDEDEFDPQSDEGVELLESLGRYYPENDEENEDALVNE